MNKRFLKYAGRCSIAFITLIGLYFLIAFCCSRITINTNPSNPKEVAIYIMTNGVHTDIVVPAVSAEINWTKEIRYQNTLEADSTYQYLAMGWGDKKFYLETPEFSDLKLSNGLRAISGLSTSAMHTTYYKKILEDASCKKIMISKTQYQQLINYILNSFRKDEAGHLINVKSNIHYDIGDAFYEAEGSYSIFKTCNTWANAALKSCGQKSCLWTIFDTGIFLKYQQ
ncbi:TIGR02117 family protein [Pedobacter sp. ISL-68]|uniref:TIGR02117 family protein n=1 Tax=unclassified Pedobacter TaxID=2628915 RepID=UPI001BE5055E|nr:MULTISPECIES: TIGR02117 family protein [unclassified Pedobacter]MBT2559938.1 TIGR02117 family protein [Pedobacter sp. ISL-64]MBT2592243.1 TIGR02117 family protein [Pedobacter sp. ISL-68]